MKKVFIVSELKNLVNYTSTVRYNFRILQSNISTNETKRKTILAVCQDLGWVRIMKQ